MIDLTKIYKEAASFLKKKTLAAGKEPQVEKRLDLILDESGRKIKDRLDEVKSSLPFIGRIVFHQIGEDGEIEEKPCRTLSGVVVLLSTTDDDLAKCWVLSPMHEVANLLPIPGGKIIVSIEMSNREADVQLIKAFREAMTQNDTDKFLKSKKEEGQNGPIQELTAAVS